GAFPASRVLSTCSACLVQVAVISFKYFACGSPSFFCSGMATATFPPSSTSWPRASRRASRPATRTAEGPMSTPRRDWPRSRGTPMTRIFLGEMLLLLAVVVIVQSNVVQSQDPNDSLLYGYSRYNILGKGMVSRT